MVKKQEEKICCGDVHDCKECKVLKSLQDFSDRSLLKFVKNDLGRCDFYTGANVKRVPIRADH